tara:strand:- start:769 stop:1164 length:396 start_codon:yes stop_codon:yes gene_type:complete
MNKGLIFILILLFLVIGGFAIYTFFPIVGPVIGPCEGDSEVGEFERSIDSEQDAKQIAIDYYASINHDFTLEDLIAGKREGNWFINFADDEEIAKNRCFGPTNLQTCVGPLILKEKIFGKNKINKRYPLAC